MGKKHAAQSYSYRIALGGIIAALCMLGMFLSGVIPMLYLLLPMMCSGLICIMAMETSPAWGILTYVSVGLLSIFITPNKDAALVFILFFGYYPLLRPVLRERFPGPLAFLLCLGVFNAAVFAFFYGAIYILGAEELWESLGRFGRYGGYILLGIANVMFWSYDYLMGIFPEAYQKGLKPRIFPRH